MTEREWKPIESAPRDGAQVLAYAKDEHGLRYYGVAQWAQANAAFPNTVAGWFWPYAIRPSHWMPLPPPPTQEPNHE